MPTASACEYVNNSEAAEQHLSGFEDLDGRTGSTGLRRRRLRLHRQAGLERPDASSTALLGVGMLVVGFARPFPEIHLARKCFKQNPRARGPGLLFFLRSRGPIASIDTVGLAVSATSPSTKWGHAGFNRRTNPHGRISLVGFFIPGIGQMR